MTSRKTLRLNMDLGNTPHSEITLTLGTAQLGMVYGIANRGGKPDFSQALEIVRTAWESGISYFDTAQVYGDSEAVLGRCFRELSLDRGAELPAVITKIDPSLHPEDEKGILIRVDESLENLGVNTLYGLMIHRESWLDHFDEALVGIIMKLKKEEKVRRFGVSVYSMEKAIAALDHDGIDMIQLPFNIFDQRAVEWEIFKKAKEAGKKIFVRSIFLQGLLLLDPDNVPEKLRFSKDGLQRLSILAGSNGISSKLLAMAFVIRNVLDAMIVIGCETADQLRENIDLYIRAKGMRMPDMRLLASQDPRLINPSLWPH
jgi:aryl-alcohol dehydrogenase-like predicted oxidoreductase